MKKDSAVGLLAGLRLVVGVASWTTPRFAGRLFGLDAEANPQSPYLARLFGARDVALAWGALGSEGEARKQWLIAGLACDAADVLAGIAGGRRGYLPKLTSVLVSGTAVSAVALGVAALSDE
jgi:DNA-binding NarL/FixJ family response regulator